jgi:hypothetical protein
VGKGLALCLVVGLVWAVVAWAAVARYPIRGQIYQFVDGSMGPLPAIQTIASGDTIRGDACGGLKRITAAGAVTTSTSATFTAATTMGGAACEMVVCNVGVTNSITLDNNAAFLSIGAADIVLTANDCTRVISDGLTWRSSGSLVAN